MNPAKSLHGELTAARLYRVVAEHEDEARQKRLFQQLTGEAEQQAEHWRRELAHGGRAAAPFRPPFRKRVIAALVRLLGPRRLTRALTESGRSGFSRRHRALIIRRFHPGLRAAAAAVPAPHGIRRRLDHGRRVGGRPARNRRGNQPVHGTLRTDGDASHAGGRRSRRQPDLGIRDAARGQSAPGRCSRSSSGLASRTDTIRQSNTSAIPASGWFPSSTTLSSVRSVTM